MENCIFCKIVRKEVAPPALVYEDTDTIAFLDVRPHYPGHTLVIPKKHLENIYDLDDQSLVAVIHTVRRMARAIKKAMQADGINVSMNNDPAAGQVIPHAHFHIIPRKENDPGYTHAHTYKDGEPQEIAEKIKKALTA